ncbi:hypothetical protein TNCT_328141 [Trichonephila clavata]|uniref:Uncharacterized protein n=1 Tax=Trichonephila clavata TaxID=2740835 RepID=A0A8X6IUE6_TRICU|nr:hypothetical protein TNCT_328141 [Trichonephila clavata]
MNQVSELSGQHRMKKPVESQRRSPVSLLLLHQSGKSSETAQNRMQYVPDGERDSDYPQTITNSRKSRERNTQPPSLICDLLFYRSEKESYHNRVRKRHPGSGLTIKKQGLSS